MEVYKEALNAATKEVRKAKRNFEHKFAQNIKSDSKSFYAYVRSKQNGEGGREGGREGGKEGGEGGREAG